MVQVASAYISAAANRFSGAAYASSQSLVAFGSSKQVALWNADHSANPAIVETLSAHRGRVTCVRFAYDDLIVCGDDTGAVTCWINHGPKWTQLSTVQAHASSVSALSVHKKVLATGSSDCSVKIWSLDRSSKAVISEVQQINLRNNLPLALDLSRLPRSQAVVLAIGSTDKTVQIWSHADDAFVQVATLPGHEDWVKCLAFRSPSTQEDPLILASGSQDSTIRLWNFESIDQQPQKGGVLNDGGVTDDLLDAFEASLGDLPDAEEGGRQITMKRHVFSTKEEGTSQQYAITFDALLVGHEAGVTSLAWRPTIDPASAAVLLSTSTDSSAILWSPSPLTAHNQSTSLWINQQRFGDVGGQRLGGFVGGMWGQQGTEVLAWGWSGGWRRWRSDQAGRWSEVSAIGGHNGAVRGICWSPEGEYLISAGPDQTTRIHGEISAGDSNTEGAPVTRVWQELARPQVHGYDLVDAVFLDALRFVSIADEKVVRVFEAPQGFVRLAKHLGILDESLDETARPLSASVPPLGLSNKATSEAVNASTSHGEEQPPRPPFEGELAAITLWPETEKVFGHGYESIALAASNSKKLIATACKATTAEHAVIRVYETEKWQPVGRPLSGHALTVTRIAFSPDDRYILSVSRDRTWRLFRRSGDADGYEAVAADKSHGRIIWDCAWTGEGDLFATASRDKTVAIWSVPADLPKKWTAVQTLKLNDAATAVAFAHADASRYLAVGLESGAISLYHNVVSDAALQWHLATTIEPGVAHIDHIYQLEWRPGVGRARQLASCSEDGTLKVLEVHGGGGN